MPQVLIIDDNDAERFMLQSELHEAGYRTLTAKNGNEGILKAKQYMPDLILCDIVMPEIDGFSTYKAIKDNPLTTKLPFVFLTGNVDAMNGKLGRELSGEEYIEKPFSFSKLLAVVQSRIND